MTMSPAPADNPEKTPKLRLWLRPLALAVAGIAGTSARPIVDRRVAGRLRIGAVADAIIAFRASAVATATTTAGGFGYGWRAQGRRQQYRHRGGHRQRKPAAGFQEIAAVIAR